jgi:2-hydroxychromene-2-carboxylate isomerase
VFAAYFQEDRDISRDDVLRAVAVDVGLDADELLAVTAAPASKERIRANTEECVRRGGFGSPTMFVDDDMYFGNDRLVLLEDALQRTAR